MEVYTIRKELTPINCMSLRGKTMGLASIQDARFGVVRMRYTRKRKTLAI
jgi:hypothetical protein